MDDFHVDDCHVEDFDVDDFHADFLEVFFHLTGGRLGVCHSD